MQGLRAVLDRHSLGLPARLYRLIHHAVVVAGVAAVVAGTHAGSVAAHGGLIGWTVRLAAAAMILDFLVRFLVIRGTEGAHGLARRFTGSMLIDLSAALALPAAWASGLWPAHAELAGLVWVLKLARHFDGLRMLGRIIRNSSEPLASVLVGFVIVLLLSATGAYLLEGEAQPEAFGSVPAAAWWAIVTLTTTGYGDVTPQSFGGRLLAGVVMVCGIGVFGLWAGILASGFVDELRRRNFIATWSLVAGVPFFRSLGADAIGQVAGLLKRRDIGARAVVMRAGDAGDAMYFIAEGEVEVRVKPAPIRLGPGAFFGEMALISGAPRSATVVARQQSVLLELDVADFRLLAAQLPQLSAAIEAEAARRRDGGAAPAKQN